MHENHLLPVIKKDSWYLILLHKGVKFVVLTDVLLILRMLWFYCIVRSQWDGERDWERMIFYFTLLLVI